MLRWVLLCFFFFQAEDGIRDDLVTGVQTCALPISTEPDPRHQYVDAGAYAVSLRVTDDDGAVVERSEETLVVRNRAPTAAFSAVPDASDPALVRFREGAWDADGTVADWRWDFGGGST